MYQNFSADGTGTEMMVYNGELHVHVSGTFGSGTLTIQFQGDDGIWRSLAGASWTSAADEMIDFGNNNPTRVRPVLAGATSPDLDVNLRD